MTPKMCSLLILLACLTGCASYPNNPDQYCSSNALLLDAHFEGGMLGHCKVEGDTRFNLTLFPEDKPPINVSPWYAFRLSGTEGTDVSLRLEFHDGYARYWPKVSVDRINWMPLPADQVMISEDGEVMSIELTLEKAQVWLAAQELLTSDYYEQWVQELSALPGARTELAGKSVQGRPIYMTDTGTQDEVIILIGRQHPPEVTGPIAMRPFVDTLLAGSELARQFRARYRLIILPSLNPDGVAAGYWRHNVNGVDLNRDWGPFTQPETQILRDWLAAPEQATVRPRLMFDFHSTMKNVFYTQRDIDPTDPENFTQQWLARSKERLPDYPFEREANKTSAQPNSKNYFYTRYGIPAITYETGDEAPRKPTEAAAVIFAEEMMSLMLEYPEIAPAAE